MSKGKVAVVTGANKGIGFAVVRALCKQFNGDVYLTSRDEGRGKAALAEFQKEGLSPKYHQLDITDKGSIERLRASLQETYGGLDVLVNNAAMAYKTDSTAPAAEQAEVSVRTNFVATLDVCNILFPILRPHARVVNVSSMASTFALGKCSSDMQKKLRSCTELDQVCSLMSQFVADVQAGVDQKNGWASSKYGMSKLGVTMLTPIFQAQLDKDSTRPDIVVNACCPGYVDTDMTSHKGHLTIDQGAEIPVSLSLLPSNVASPRGEFVMKGEIVAWK